MNKSAILTLGTLGGIMASTAKGAPLYSATGFNVDSVTTTYAWNIDATGTSEVTIRYSGNGNLKFSNFANNFGIRTYKKSAAAPYELQAVNAPSVVGPSMTFGHTPFRLFSTSSPNAVGFTNGHGYMAFTFSDSGTTYYGWASVSLGNNNITVNSWACSTSPITVGDTNVSGVPEPAETSVGLGALALGAAGLFRMRRRKAAAPRVQGNN